MVVLVAYATRHGATAGIAERLAAGLCDNAVAAVPMPVDEVRDVRAHDAVVLGGAAYMFHWLKDATSFARRTGWPFASGRSGCSAAAPSAPTWSTRTADVDGDLPAQGVRRVDRAAPGPRGTGLLRRLRPRRPLPRRSAAHVRPAPPRPGRAAGRGLPRDWSAIDLWAGEIAAALAADVSRT